MSSEGTMAETNPLRYRGYYYDTETGLYYLMSRYYDPATCRFVNADGYASTGDGILGFNMFAYCNNNPICYIDPSGYAAVLAGAVAAAMSALLLSTVFRIVTSSAFRQAVKDVVADVSNKVSSFVSNAVDRIQASAALALERMSKACIERADARVRATVKEDSKNRFWSANVKRGYVDIGRPLTYNQAVRYVASGRSVFAVTRYEAKSVARAAGGSGGQNNTPLYPEIDSGRVNAPGYYYHFHTYNRNGGHVYYLFP